MPQRNPPFPSPPPPRGSFFSAATQGPWRRGFASERVSRWRRVRHGRESGACVSENRRRGRRKCSRIAKRGARRCGGKSGGTDGRERRRSCESGGVGWSCIWTWRTWTDATFHPRVLIPHRDQRMGTIPCEPLRFVPCDDLHVHLACVLPSPLSFLSPGSTPRLLPLVGGRMDAVRGSCASRTRVKPVRIGRLHSWYSTDLSSGQTSPTQTPLPSRRNSPWMEKKLSPPSEKKLLHGWRRNCPLPSRRNSSMDGEETPLGSEPGELGVNSKRRGGMRERGWG